MSMEPIYSKMYVSARQRERERVQEFIEDIKNSVATCFFLNLFAPKGFGKTVFLEQVWKDYERVLPVSLVHMGKFCQKSDEAFALDNLLVHIIRDLGERLPRRVASLPSDYENWMNENQLAELLLCLVSGAKEFEKVSVLLIDDYDLMSEKQGRWFQENIFSPIARTRKVGVILTSKTELRFAESFDLRMRLESHELSSLDPEAISRALPKYEAIAGEIHRITGGLPLLTEEFIEQLETSQVIIPNGFRLHAQELSRKYYRTYVEEKVLADLTPDLRETVLIMALLRRFDVKMLKEVLPRLLPELYQVYGTADYLDLIDRLRPWVQWRRQGGYTLNPAFRTMLQGYTLTVKPDLFKGVNRTAVILYQGWLESEYREYYLLELLYHRLVLLESEKDSTPPTLLMALGKELQPYISGESKAGSRRMDDLDSLRNSLLQDPDLKDYVSEDVLRAIQDKINAQIEMKRVIPFRRTL